MKAVGDQLIKPKKARKPPEFKSYVEGKIVFPEETLDAIKKVLALTSTLFNDEIPMELETHKLSVRVMDPSSKLMVEYIFPKSIFKEFHLEYLRGKLRRDKQPLRFSVNISDILHAIRDVYNATVTIEFKLTFLHVRKVERKIVYKPRNCPKCGLEVKDDNNKREAGKRGKRGNLYTCIKCGWKGKARGKYKDFKIFEDRIKGDGSSVLVTVNSDVKEEYPVTLCAAIPKMIPVPTIDFLTSQTLISKEFCKKIEKLGRLCDFFAISNSKEGIVIEGLSKDRGCYNNKDCGRITIRKDSGILLNTEGRKLQRAVFSMGLFKKLLPRSKGIADFIKLDWNTDQLIRITWQVNTLADALIRFFLAPELIGK